MPIKDHYEDTYSDKTEPPGNCFAVTPHDIDPLPEVVRSLSVNTSGTVTFRLKDQATPIDVYMERGVQYVGRFTHIHASGTDAAGIRAWV